jgi:hypothetical protein
MLGSREPPAAERAQGRALAPRATVRRSRRTLSRRARRRPPTLPFGEAPPYRVPRDSAVRRLLPPARSTVRPEPHDCLTGRRHLRRRVWPDQFLQPPHDRLVVVGNDHHALGRCPSSGVPRLRQRARPSGRDAGPSGNDRWASSQRLLVVIDDRHHQRRWQGLLARTERRRLIRVAFLPKSAADNGRCRPLTARDPKRRLRRGPEGSALQGSFVPPTRSPVSGSVRQSCALAPGFAVVNVLVPVKHNRRSAD